MVEGHRYEGQCLGEVLLALTHPLLPFKQSLQQILRRSGLTQIERQMWYELSQVRRFCYDVLAGVGERTVFQAGFQMGGSALWQTRSTQLAAMLQELDACYQALVRGPQVGRLTVELDDLRCAKVGCDVMLPCAFSQGVLQAKVKSLAPVALVEHAEDGCRDKTADCCTYLVSW